MLNAVYQAVIDFLYGDCQPDALRKALATPLQIARLYTLLGNVERAITASFWDPQYAAAVNARSNWLVRTLASHLENENELKKLKQSSLREINSLKRDLHESKRARLDLLKVNAGVSWNLEELETRHRWLRMAQEQLLNHMETVANAHQQELDAMARERDAALADVQQLRDELGRANAALEESQLTLEEQLKTSKATVTDLEEQLKASKGELGQLRAERDAAKAVATEVKAQCSAMAQTPSADIASNEVLPDETRKLCVDMDHLRGAVRQQAASVAELVEHLHAVTDESDHLRGAVRQQAASVAELVEHLHAVTDERDHLLGEVDRLKVKANACEAFANERLSALRAKNKPSMPVLQSRWANARNSRWIMRNSWAALMLRSS
jgi:DNA repair exonuclease SbcCD ATPase subunit